MVSGGKILTVDTKRAIPYGALSATRYCDPHWIIKDILMFFRTLNDWFEDLLITGGDQTALL
jgi:hypothetical protein